VESVKLIPGLHGTATHELSVLLYRRHHDAGNGMCAQCGSRVPCQTRRHAMIVIIAAGDRPDRHNAQPAYSPIDESSADRTGYRVGGRGRAVDPNDAGYSYDRHI